MRRERTAGLGTRGRGIHALWFLSAGLLVSHTAGADEKLACIDAHAKAQELRQKGELLAAQEQFATCARSSCPPVLRADCSQSLARVEAAQPTIVVKARDAKGQDVMNALVRLDGEIIQQRLDGRARAVDPGEHQIRIEGPDGRTIDRQLLVAEGEKRRLIEVTFPGPKPEGPGPTAPQPRQPEASSHFPTGPVVLGALSVAGFVSFGYFGLTGTSRESELEDTCAPRCSQSEIDGLRTRYLIADVSLGAGVVLAAAAVWWALTLDGSDAPRTDSPDRSGARTPRGPLATEPFVFRF